MKEPLIKFQTPLGESITLHKHYWDGGSVYETLSIVAGLFGNQFSGIYIANRLIQFLQNVSEEQAEGYKLLGKVQIFPVINAPALQTGNGIWPFDNMDLDFGFPGNDTGEFAERICQALLQHSSQSSCGIVFDTGTPHYEDFPHIQFINPNRQLKKMAGSLNLGIARTLPESQVPKTQLMRYWSERELPAMTISSGKIESINIQVCEQIIQGIINLMLMMDILGNNQEKFKKSDFSIYDSRQEFNLFTNQPGMFLPEINVGDTLKEGQSIGKILDVMDGRVLEKIYSPTGGLVLRLRIYPLVYETEPIAIILKEKKISKFWPF